MGGGRYVQPAGAPTAVMRIRKFLATAVIVAALPACAPNSALIVHFPLGNTQCGPEAFVALESREPVAPPRAQLQSSLR
jgi:hypothetical protein